VLTMITFLSSAWWYLVVTGSLDGGGALREHFTFAARAEGWQGSWLVYVKKLPFLLGPAGAVLTGLGAVLLAMRIWRWRRDKIGSSPGSVGGPASGGWPLAILVPSLMVLSLLPSKVVWVLMVVLQAVAVAAVFAALRRLPKMGRMAGVVFGIVVLVLQVYPTMTQAYETRMKQVAEDQWRGARRSREAAMAVNDRIGVEDQLLVTSFHYWQGLSSGAPCAVFTYYLRPNIPVLLRPSDAGFASLMRDVRNYDIDWALLSPTPGPQAQEVIGGFVKAMGITPVRLEGAFLFEIPDLVSP